MGHEFTAEVLEAGPDTDAPPPARSSRRFRCCCPRSGVRADRVQQHDVGGYARADAAVGAAAAARSQRPRPAPRGADRADGGRPARGQQVVDRAGRGRARARAAARSGSPSSPRCAIAGSNTSWPPTIRHDAAGARDDDGRPRGRRSRASGVTVRRGDTRPVVFEAVGVPGIINDVLRRAPARHAARRRRASAWSPTPITPFFGIGKELNVQFVLRLRPEEFAEYPARDRRG